MRLKCFSNLNTLSTERKSAPSPPTSLSPGKSSFWRKKINTRSAHSLLRCTQKKTQIELIGATKNEVSHQQTETWQPTVHVGSEKYWFAVHFRCAFVIWCNDIYRTSHPCGCSWTNTSKIKCNMVHESRSRHLPFHIQTFSALKNQCKGSGKVLAFLKLTPHLSDVSKYLFSSPHQQKAKTLAIRRPVAFYDITAHWLNDAYM